MDITTKELAQIINNLFCADGAAIIRSSESLYEVVEQSKFLAALENHTLRNPSFGCITELCVRACVSGKTMGLLDDAAKEVRIAVSKIKKGET